MLIKVRMTQKAIDSGRAVLHEQNAAHPGGSVAIDTPEAIYAVAETSAIFNMLSLGLIERVVDEAPVIVAPVEKAPAPVKTEHPVRGKRRG